MSFTESFKLFPEQLKREKFDECIFVGDRVTDFLFSPSFPGFFLQKFKFP